MSFEDLQLPDSANTKMYDAAEIEIGMPVKRALAIAW